MQKAPVIKGTGLQMPEKKETNEEVHVFGKNLEERVVTNDEQKLSPITFGSVATSQTSKEQEDEDIESIRKRKFDAITGEEDEETIFQSEFKLFVWDLGTCNWVEKGRGQLRLNDSTSQDNKDRKSRLIMRVNGTHRILLNVGIRPAHFRIIANSKTNIRFTDGQFVWAASGGSAQQLKVLLEDRLKKDESASTSHDTSESGAGDDSTSEPTVEDTKEPALNKTDEPDADESKQSTANETDDSVPTKRSEPDSDEEEPRKKTKADQDSSSESDENKS